MITGGICNSYKEEVLLGYHQEGDTFCMALFTSAGSLGPDTTFYSAGTTPGEVQPTYYGASTGYSTGGFDLAGPYVVLNGTVASLTFDSPTWSNATWVGTNSAVAGLIYNATTGGNTVAVLSFNGTLSPVNATATVLVPGNLITMS
jgi:hypothetical protein